MNKCSACSNPVGPNAITCPNCGEPTYERLTEEEQVVEDKEFSQYLSNVSWIGFILFALGLFSFDLFIDNGMESGLLYILSLGSGALGVLVLGLWAILAFSHYTGF